MLTSQNVSSFLDEILSTHAFKDSSQNGLQVESEAEIRKVGFAVDASAETFEKAVKTGCQMLVVHHGIIWGGLGAIVGVTYQRIKCLLQNQLALYASHLPLDAHPEYGNNIQIAKLLGLSEIRPFGVYADTLLGYLGRLHSTLDGIQDALKRHGMKTMLLPFGKKDVETVAIVSGGASDILPQAASQGADLFITGEPVHHVHHLAKEHHMNVLFGGHYETEMWGVKALMPVLHKQFGVETDFLDVPTIV